MGKVQNLDMKREYHHVLYSTSEDEKWFWSIQHHAALQTIVYDPAAEDDFLSFCQTLP